MADKTILIVDDTPANIAAALAILKDQYRTKVATSGAKALEHAGAAVVDPGAQPLRYSRIANAFPPPSMGAGQGGGEAADPGQSSHARLRGLTAPHCSRSAEPDSLGVPENASVSTRQETTGRVGRHRFRSSDLRRGKQNRQYTAQTEPACGNDSRPFATIAEFAKCFFQHRSYSAVRLGHGRTRRAQDAFSPEPDHLIITPTHPRNARPGGRPSGGSPIEGEGLLIAAAIVHNLLTGHGGLCEYRSE